MKKLKQNKVDLYMMSKAQESANQSYCKKLKVGAVFSKDNRAFIDGYNGTLKGLKNCCEKRILEFECFKCQKNYSKKEFKNLKNEKICSQCNGTEFNEKFKELKTSEFVAHAEQNIIYYAARKGIKLEGGTIYSTYACCDECAKAIASVGIKRFVYLNEYKNKKGVNFLKKLKIKVIKL